MLNDDTLLLEDALIAEGWVGTRRWDPADPSRPPDLRDGVVDPDFAEAGRDDEESDAAAFSMFAGHANYNTIAWRHQDDEGSCLAIPSRDVSLGSYAGRASKMALFSTSCTGYAPDLWDDEWNANQIATGLNDFNCSLGWSETWQHLAYYDSPASPDWLPQAFFLNLGTTQGAEMANLDSWMLVASHPDPDIWNQPIAFTTNINGEDDVFHWERHYFANLRTGFLLDDQRQCFEYWDWYHATISYVDDWEGNEDPETPDPACATPPDWSLPENEQLCLGG